MAARKKARAKKATAAKPAPSSVDLSDVSVKQIAALVSTLGVLVVAGSAIFGWFFNADHSHSLTKAHDPRIVILEQNDAEYETIWADAKIKRIESIKTAESYCDANPKECKR